MEIDTFGPFFLNFRGDSIVLYVLRASTVLGPVS